MSDQDKIKDLERRVENLERIIVGLQGNDDRLKEELRKKADEGHRHLSSMRIG